MGRVRRLTSARITAFVVVAAILTACAKDSPAAPVSTPAYLPFGEWGGYHVQVLASDSLTDVIDGCTGGTFAGNVRLNGVGFFSVDGSWVPYFLTSVAMPAQMSGQVTGNSMTFAIAVYDTIQKKVISVPPVTAVLGQPADIVVCP
jgi:hypothetical protein